MTFLDPGQDPTAATPQRADILGQQQQAKRQHPQAKYRQDGKDAADDQQQPRRNPKPPRGWPQQPVYTALNTFG
jgi:hypothetical protein